jgi:metal iron transporter
VAYTDPGNWVTDLAAGSQFGYALLFVILLSGLFGIFLQILAVRMGVVTSDDLARNTRLWLLPDDDGRPIIRKNDLRRANETIKYRNARIAVLWLLYLVSEGAIVATELAELLGSAIALNLLFPGLPLWAGVVITCADVMLILFIYKPQGNFRIFEVFISILVFIVMGCYIILLVRVKPHWGNVFRGYVPSSTLVQPQALYTGIGIMGAVIMPHALYLGSHFSTINRLDGAKHAARFVMDPADAVESAVEPTAPWHVRTFHGLRTRIADRFPSIDAHLRHRANLHPATPAHQRSTFDTNDGQPSFAKTVERMSIAEIKVHLPHAAWDISLSLFFFAITVNSAILIVAAAAFYYGPSGTQELGNLYDAYNLLRDTLGKAYAILFAIALLAAGQSASLTCTLSGQIVSEGFINWKTNPFLRRMVTRILTMIPAVVVAVGVGPSGVDEMLVASQVALAFALPFVILPLIVITSKKTFMRIEEPLDPESLDNEQEEQLSELTAKRSVLPKEGRSEVQSPADVISPLSADAILPHTSKACVPRSDGIDKDPQASHVGPYMQDNLPSPQHGAIHDFTNHWTVITLASLIFTAIVLADLYSLAMTIKGDDG